MKKYVIILVLLVTGLSYAQFTAGQTDSILIVESPFDGFATFDLTINQAQTLNGEDPASVSITYHNSLADAFNDDFPIANPTSYMNTSNPESIYIRMESVSNPSFFQTTSFDISVESTLPIGTPADQIVYELPFDGSATFDLTLNENQVIDIIDPSTIFVTYYNSQADADSQANPIASPTAYTNFANPETIFVRVELVSDPSVFSTTSFTLFVSDDVVDIPDADFLNALIINNVDTNNSGNIQFFEAEAVQELNLFDQFISNLTGLEAFININALSVEDNFVSDLDLSANVNLQALYCGKNQIQNLDLSNNPLLEFVDASVNPLTQIDLTNNTLLETLWLIDTDLDNIDLSNNIALTELQFLDSDITTLDLTNNSNLETLFIVNNPLLETVFIKNGADESASMNSGSWLENWLQANNPSLQYVCADDFQVLDIQQWAGTDYVVNSFCSVQPGGDVNTITGVAQFDVNNDGCDSSDPVIPFLGIDAGPGPSTLIPAVTTTQNGEYTLYIGQAGDYTLQPQLENPSYFTISPNFPMVNLPVIDSSTTTQDFCITANGTINDAEVVIAPVFPSNPGFDATYKLVYKNKGNQILSGSVNFQYDDTVLDFVSSSLVPDAQSTGSLTYNFTNLLPFENRDVEITLNVNGPMETPAVNIDDVLDYTATINIDQTEETPDDNTFDYSEIVVGSYDPNDITCLQGDVVSGDEIGEFLHYMIRFENTGTAAAQKVVVTTEINPADFNINTLQVLSASHDMFLRNNNGVLEFVFENIMLPPSSTSGGGHGNILLKIRTLDNLTLTDEVDAQADIYFDFNFPIITNIANTSFETLSTTGFSSSIDVQLYPNPVEDVMTIESYSSIQHISIYDIQGRIVAISRYSDATLKTSLDISPLPKGIYLVEIKTSSGILTKKVIKN